MLGRDQFEDCMTQASEALSLAEKTHREVRQTVSAAPRYDKYLEASECYSEAARAFLECKAGGSGHLEVGMADAWEHYALAMSHGDRAIARYWDCLLYTSPSPRDRQRSRMPSSA